MIYDNPLTRTKRPGANNNESSLDDLTLTKAPDITADIDAIDKALAEAAKVKEEPKIDRCGCW